MLGTQIDVGTVHASTADGIVTLTGTAATVGDIEHIVGRIGVRTLDSCNAAASNRTVEA